MLRVIFTLGDETETDVIKNDAANQSENSFPVGIL